MKGPTVIIKSYYIDIKALSDFSGCTVKPLIKLVEVVTFLVE